MSWVFDQFHDVPQDRDVLLLVRNRITGNKRAVVSNWIPTLAGIPGHWSGLLDGERAVAWSALPEIPAEMEF